MMKDKSAVMILCTLLLASILTFGFNTMPANAANEDVQVYIDPVDTYGVTGDLFTLNVKIDDVTDLFGFDFNITWDDSTLISLNETFFESFFDVIWPGGWFAAINATGTAGGYGYYKLVATSTSTGLTSDPGTSTLFAMQFKVERHCNFELTTTIGFDTAKLSNSSFQPIAKTLTPADFHTTPQTPTIELTTLTGTAPPYEWGHTFDVEFGVGDICADLEGYNFTANFNDDLLELLDVDFTGGELGGAGDGADWAYTIDSGTFRVTDIGGTVFSGPEGLLFTVAFRVNFDALSPDHIWRVGAVGPLPATVVDFASANLTFDLGLWDQTGINMPSLLTQNIVLIQGDANCDGQVEVEDLRAVATYYDAPTPLVYPASLYDLTDDAEIDIFDLVVIATNYNYGVP